MKKLLISTLALIVVALAALGFMVWRYPLAIFNQQNRRELIKAGFVKSSVATKAGSQTLFEKGRGPTLILLHGAGDQAGTWSKAAPELAKKYHVLALDLAGHGESEPKSGTLPLAAILNGLDGVIAAKSPNDRVILVGNSLGAWMAVYYAHEHPEKIARVVAIDGGPIRGERPDLVNLPKNREEAAKVFDAILDPGSAHPAGFVLDDVVRQARNGPIGRMAEAGAPEMSKYLLDGKLADFKTPLDLLWGESDRMMPLSYAQRLRREIPAASLNTIKRCGHVPQQECPNSFSRALASVLALPVPAPTQAAPEKVKLP
jgi:pimeloyl-ACP methyl ester carboxylesterase